MKKSVLIALLGLSTAEGMQINQKESSKSSGTPEAKTLSQDNSTNTTGSATLIQDGYELVETIVALDAKQDAFDHQEEMDEADDDADAVVKEADDEGDEDDDEEALAGVQTDIYGPPAAAAAAAGAAAAPALAAAAAPAKAPKNKDSSDEECACAPNKESTKQKAAIRAKQEKRVADAKKARTAATASKVAAEEAIAAANLAKRTGAKNVLELAKAAEDAISSATVAENKSISK